ncbi:MAG: bifunctional UDP-N-acetylglucosamine diphosphorylase/glucosamine-1-phosphate N-acetyltransferase GlmU [Nocardioidaceae bacterium]
MTRTRPAAVIVLAAGGGTRMKSQTPKVLHAIGGRSLIGHALRAARSVEPDHLVVVVGHGRDQVGPAVSASDPGVTLVVQEEQLGTGHAVQIALAELPALSGTVLVTYGDVPLLAGDTLAGLVRQHESDDNAVTVLTARVDDPTGYGRVVRAADGGVSAIVEHKDATDEQLAIDEINSGIYGFDAAVLSDALGRVGSDNAQGELYLTDVVGIARGDGRRTGAFETTDRWQTEGVNDRVQLATLGAELNRRTLVRHMRAGVTVVDPASTWIDDTVTVEPDVTVLPGVQLHGATQIGAGATIGPDSTLTDVKVGAGASVVRTHGSGAVLGAGVNVGPFSYLRPGTVLGEGGKIGAFVEAKNATIGAGSKVPHLSYVGDAEIGEQTNIGAGTIFANYDGVEKHRTTIGSHCRTSSNNTFVAPVNVADGAATGAGTVVRRDVPPGALAVSSGPQRHIEDWVVTKRAGTPAAEAALKAQQASGDTDPVTSGDTAEENDR